MHQLRIHMNKISHPIVGDYKYGDRFHNRMFETEFSTPNLFLHAYSLYFMHPITLKKALYINKGFTSHLVGIPIDESDGILSYLFEHMENPLFQCRFKWQKNSIAFWDNRCVQHRAMWDYWPNTRSGHRITVAGDRPFFQA